MARFDLLNGIRDLTGTPPYASELYGVYQPLLGWQSRLTKDWAAQGATVDPRVRAILDGRLIPGPTGVNTDPIQVTPLVPASGRRTRTVVITQSLQSELIRFYRERVEDFVQSNGGELPNGEQWNRVIEFNQMIEPDTGDLRVVNDRVLERLTNAALRAAPGGQLTPEQEAEIQAKLLEIMRYESQIATFLLVYAESQGGADPNELRRLFQVRIARPFSDVFGASDPLDNIDPNDRGGALAPVGFVHLFRQYFFDLGTFLGEPVEHVWLAPGTTIELVEVSTRKVIQERTLTEMTQTTSRTELDSVLKDEISDAIKDENKSSTKLGVSQNNTVNLYVYQGTLSTTFGLESTRSTAREVAHKQNREQTEKLSTEIKKSFKSVFKTVTENTDVRSRRHIMTNPGNTLINYEMRRKMRRVGVQVQDIGTRLCWQVFVDTPGTQLGLAELVDLVEAPDLANLKEPEKLPEPAAVVKKVTVPIPFLPILDYTNNNVWYEFAYVEPPNGRYAGKALSKIHGVEDEEDRDDQTIMGPFEFTIDPPQTGYELTEVRLVGVQGGKVVQLKENNLLNVSTGKFSLVLQRVHFGGENAVNLDMELAFSPTAAERQRVRDANKAIADKFDADKQRIVRKSYLEAVRDRVRAASEVRPRPSWDLREEERTVVYRKLIERLMLDSWKGGDDIANRRVGHLRSEVIRSLFDVDSMLYFVAPEWWVPRRRSAHLDLTSTDLGAPTALTDDDLVTWGGERRPNNYPITEDSATARMGTSLGWLLQLDGDNLRNAFLNAPWVKAVIPIQPGRETAALNWLRSIEGHDQDGWDVPYAGGSEADAEFQGMTIGQVLEETANRLEEQNAGITSTLAADKVFEHGFDHLAQGFDAALPPEQVFSQWVSVLPTDQIVAVEYRPTDLSVAGEEPQPGGGQP